MPRLRTHVAHLQDRIVPQRLLDIEAEFIVSDGVKSGFTENSPTTLLPEIDRLVGKIGCPGTIVYPLREIAYTGFDPPGFASIPIAPLFDSDPCARNVFPLGVSKNNPNPARM